MLGSAKWVGSAECVGWRDERLGWSEKVSDAAGNPDGNRGKRWGIVTIK